MFDRTVMEQVDPIAQQVAPGVFKERELSRAGGRQRLAELARVLGPENANDPAFRYLAEGIQMDAPDAVKQAAQMWSDQLGPEYLAAQQDWGVKVAELSSRHGIRHFPKQVAKIEGEVQDVVRSSGATPFDPTAAFTQQREEIFDLPGGAEQMEKVVRDPRLATVARTSLTDKDAAQILMGEFGAAPDQAEGLANWLATLDPQRLEKGLYRSPILDAHDYMQGAEDRIGMAKVVQQTLAQAAEDVATPGARQVKHVLHQMGLENNPKKMGVSQLGVIGDKLESWVPAEMAESLTNGARAFLLPKQVEGLVKAWDGFTDFFKKSLTTIWPGFHTRNLGSAWWQNYVLGLNPADLEPYKFARAALTGDASMAKGAGNIWLFKGMNLTDQQAMQEISNLAFAHRVTGPNFLDLAKPGHDVATELMGQIPGVVPSQGVLGDLGQIAKEFPKAPFESGRKVGSGVEDTMRMAGFYGLLKKGYTPEVAAAQVRAAQVDYAALTGFERNIMRRLIPFYSFSRHNIPFQIKQVMESPGGRVGTAVKVSGKLRSQEGDFLPEYLGQGVALPLGSEEGGVQSYLTRLGLPFEQVFDVLDPSSLVRSLENIAGQAHPLLKGPAELFTGRQFFTGRNLKEAYSPTGSTVADQLIYNSPIARGFSTAKTILDPRKDPVDKALNLTTGLKISDVNQDVQRDIVARNLLEDVLGDNEKVRSLNRFYVKDEDLPYLTPDEVQFMRLYRTFEDRARKKAKEKEKKKK
jgi:hypothetical protein